MKNTKTHTLTCKVDWETKDQVQRTAAYYGLTTSEYVRAILFDNHPHLEKCKSIPPELIFSESEVDAIQQFINVLHYHYPDMTVGDLITISLKIAIDNEPNWVANKIKNNLS